MRKELFKSNLVKLSLILLVLLQSCSTLNDTQLTTKIKTPKNVILFISDGCGFNNVDAASYYQFGKTGEQIYEALRRYDITDNPYQVTEGSIVVQATEESAAKAKNNPYFESVTRRGTDIGPCC